MQTLETVMREWLQSFDSPLHTILRTTPVEDFIAKNLNSAVAYAKDWKARLEPEPTRANILKELRYLLSEGLKNDPLELDEGQQKAMDDCLKAIDNGNCARDCTTCPIWKRFKVPEEDQERAMEEHRFGTGADENPHPILHMKDTE